MCCLIEAARPGNGFFTTLGDGRLPAAFWGLTLVVHFSLCPSQSIQRLQTICGAVLRLSLTPSFLVRARTNMATVQSVAR